MSDEQTTTNDNPAVETQIADAVQGTVNTVLGSEITYTPNNFGVNVVYEYNTVWSYKDGKTVKKKME